MEGVNESQGSQPVLYPNGDIKNGKAKQERPYNQSQKNSLSSAGVKAGQLRALPAPFYMYYLLLCTVQQSLRLRGCICRKGLRQSAPQTSSQEITPSSQSNGALQEILLGQSKQSAPQTSSQESTPSSQSNGALQEILLGQSKQSAPQTSSQESTPSSQSNGALQEILLGQSKQSAPQTSSQESTPSSQSNGALQEILLGQSKKGLK
ncbi:uncharacterized protein [Asterias amurensis]|uniref:uncharacterized protein isoform X1 n=1 Tax=Asterias amurensis TaxID=7602 RepID=UPI003AB547B7